MEIGEVYQVKPAFMKDSDTGGKALKGKVVYVHPKRRFAVLAFKGVHGISRECFRPEELTADKRCKRWA